MTPSRPLLRYHGGKWKLAPWIIEHFPAHKTYVEPFGGGASVLLRKPRSSAEVYNDLGGEVVNLFRVARDRGDELVRALELTPFAREEFSLSYQETTDPLEMARRLIVKSYQGFGSNSHNRKNGFRAYPHRKGGTTPANGWQTFPLALSAIVERLQGVVIENRDASLVLADFDGPNTLHYVDPPYLASLRDPGRDYSEEMSDQDHEKLAKVLHSLEGHVILSGYESTLYNDLYKGWRKVMRSTFAQGAHERLEVLWLSPNCPDAGLFKSA